MNKQADLDQKPKKHKTKSDSKEMNKEKDVIINYVNKQMDLEQRQKNYERKMKSREEGVIDYANKLMNLE